MQSKTTFSSLAIASYYMIAAGVISGGRFGGSWWTDLGLAHTTEPISTPPTR